MNKYKNKNRMKRAGSGKWEKAVSWILIAAMLLSIAGIMGCGTAQGGYGRKDGRRGQRKGDGALPGAFQRGFKGPAGHRKQDCLYG